jgi:hypothetical protein
MDEQLLATRKSKHEYHYRLFGDFMEILQYEHDRLLEIEEAMASLRDPHEFRKQNTFKTVEPHTESSYKPVKDRPPPPAKFLSLRELMAYGSCPITITDTKTKSYTTPRITIGYSSSNSCSSESTTTTTTTVRTSESSDQSIILQAAAVMTHVININTTLVGGSKVFITTTCIDITSTF